MNEKKDEITCKWCKVSLPPSHEGPCPKCGKNEGTVSLESRRFFFGHYALDHFVAPRISELKECHIPEVPNFENRSGSWVTCLILNCILRRPAKPMIKQYIFFFLRRAEAAFHEYENARHFLLDYVRGDRERISIYFKALFHFEICIAQMWQAFRMTMSTGHRITGKKKKLYEPGDGSSYERLNKLYNLSRYLQNNVQGIQNDSTIQLWLTRDGIEAQDASISYAELASLLQQIGNWADVLLKAT